MTSESSVRPIWIPLGAGGHVVRWNGIAYEAISVTARRTGARGD